MTSVTKSDCPQRLKKSTQYTEEKHTYRPLHSSQPKGGATIITLLWEHNIKNFYQIWQLFWTEVNIFNWEYL